MTLAIILEYAGAPYYFFLKQIFFQCIIRKLLKTTSDSPWARSGSSVYSQDRLRSTKFIVQLQHVQSSNWPLHSHLPGQLWTTFMFQGNGQDGKYKRVHTSIHERLDQELQNSAHIRHSHLMAAVSSYSSEQSWMEAGSFEMNGFPLPTHWAFQPKIKQPLKT